MTGINLRYLLPVLAAAALATAAGCTEDAPDDTSEWRQKNKEYVEAKGAETVGGVPVYTRISPSWAPQAYVLMKWHNDRSLTANNLQPLDNSTCDVKYEFEDVEGTVLQTSYNMQTYGDSIYRTQPCNTVIGFWTALRNMHVGDSVTVIMPAEAAYGATAYGIVKSYSTLIYHIKLKGIPAFEIPTPSK